MCAKFKVDPLSRFRTGARQVFTTQELFPCEIPLTMKTATKFSLNSFSDQVTICQISFETFDVKQIDTQQKIKYLNYIRLFPFFTPFSC